MRGVCPFSGLVSDLSYKSACLFFWLGLMFQSFGRGTMTTLWFKSVESKVRSPWPGPSLSVIRRATYIHSSLMWRVMVFLRAHVKTMSTYSVSQFSIALCKVKLRDFLIFSSVLRYATFHSPSDFLPSFSWQRLYISSRSLIMAKPDKMR